MDFREHLIRTIAYEEYANKIWLDYLDTVPGQPNGAQYRAEADKWFGHIVGCYRVWFDRLTGTEFEPTGDIRADLSAHYLRMRTFTESCDLEKPLEMSFGEEGTWRWVTRDIILHSLTHGSYHRGHLRALAETHGMDDWPDTDWETFTGTETTTR